MFMNLLAKGDCYKYGFDKLIESKTGVLVHGYIQHSKVKDLLMAHTWVVTSDGQVHDSLNMKTRTIPSLFEYTPHFNVACYTNDEIPVDLENPYGPWHHKMIHDMILKDCVNQVLNINLTDDNIIEKLQRNMSPTQCNGITKKGHQCKNSINCPYHHKPQ